MLDTGNEADYCLLSGHYFNSFKEDFKECDFEMKFLSDISGNQKRSAISVESFQLNFLTANFHSKLGFLFDISENMLNTINIGIKGISQFLNIIFKDRESYYYFCANF